MGRRGAYGKEEIQGAIHRVISLTASKKGGADKQIACASQRVVRLKKV